jgi:O-antigen/teichoic acid export membrane protein
MFPMLIGNIFSFQWLYQGFGRIKQVSMVNCICRLLILPLTFWLVKQPDDVLLAAGIQSSTFVLSGIVMTIWTVRERLFSLVPMYWRAIRMALKDSLPLFLSTATSSVYAVLFVVILGYFTTPYEVGCYAAVEKIMRVMCYLFLLPAIQVFYPHVSKLFTENRQAAQQLVRRILCVLIAVMALMGIALFFGGETAIRLLGKDYSGTESLFRIMAFVPLFKPVCEVLSFALPGHRTTTKLPQHPCRFHLFPHHTKLWCFFSSVPKRMVELLQFGSDAFEKVKVITIVRPFIPRFSFAHTDSPLFYYFLFLLQIYKKGAPFWGTP